MNNLDKDIDTIIQILTENTSYSPQAQAYIIHGAIEKLIQWRNSFLTNNNDMQVTQMAESPNYAGLTAVGRKKCCIVMHAHAMWKGYFFESAEAAAGAIRSLFPTIFFKTSGGMETTVLVDQNNPQFKFSIYTMQQFTGMEDLKRPQA